MSSAQPPVSVIIPSYNYARYLPDALNSVLSQDDGLKPEIIIVDDGSTDDTTEVAAAFAEHVLYIRQEHQGPSAARNTGLRHACGEFLIFLDADDELGPDTLKSQLENFRQNPGLDLSICHCICTNPGQTSRVWGLKAANHDLHLCFGNIAPIHSFMIRAQSMRQTGEMDFSLQHQEDYDYWLRCAAAGQRFGVNPATYALYKQHRGSLSASREQHVSSELTARLKARAFLEQNPAFPAMGKYAGWLAYAAGQISYARSLSAFAADLTAVPIREAAAGVLRAAAQPRENPPDQTQAVAEAYYAALFISYARMFGTDPGIARALGFLARAYPRLWDLPEQMLQARFQKLRQELYCNVEHLVPVLARFENSGPQNPA